jgi:uncharacterized protein YciI
MATFVLSRIDHADAADRRAATRPAHMDYMRGHGGMVKLAGAMLGETGEPAGSMFIIEAETAGEVESFAAGDPYALANVFAHTEIRQIRISVGGLA